MNKELYETHAAKVYVGDTVYGIANSEEERLAFVQEAMLSHALEEIQILIVEKNQE
jgi:hypothetical protein